MGGGCILFEITKRGYNDDLQCFKIVVFQFIIAKVVVVFSRRYLILCSV